MPDSQYNRRFWETMIGLFLLILGLASLSGGGGAMFPLLLGLLGFYLLARQFDQTNQRRSGYSEMASPSWGWTDEDEEDEIPARTASGADQV